MKQKCERKRRAEKQIMEDLCETVWFWLCRFLVYIKRIWNTVSFDDNNRRKIAWSSKWTLKPVQHIDWVTFKASFGTLKFDCFKYVCLITICRVCSSSSSPCYCSSFICLKQLLWQRRPSSSLLMTSMTEVCETRWDILLAVVSLNIGRMFDVVLRRAVMNPGWSQWKITFRGATLTFELGYIIIFL